MLPAEYALEYRICVKLKFCFQIHASQGDGTQTVHTVQTLQDSVTGESVSVDLNNVTEATLNQDGQIILTGEDGHGKLLVLYVL